MEITLPDLQSRALATIAEIEDTTPTALLMPAIRDISNGRHIRDGRREEVTESYVAWLESQAQEAKAGREVIQLTDAPE